MKVKKLIINNFRCFKESTVIDIDNLTVFAGKNDIGKSTVLEALDIFFNEAKAANPLKTDDSNVHNRSKEVFIGVVFDNFRREIVLDTSVTTTLDAEYLLNSAGLLQIHKKYSSGKLKEVSLLANHPSNAQLKNLLSLKIEDLKTRASELSVDPAQYDARISSSIRNAIKQHLLSSTTFAEQEIVIYKEKEGNEKTAVKEIWNQLQDYLPVYSLFQSDRKNEEKDSEVQDPMKSAIKQILKDTALQTSLSEIREKVEAAAKEVADKTISKLKEMNPELAQELKAEFSDPSWDSAFKFTFKSDDNIPLDKRGSGVRRLILLNFFRAEAEKKQKERNVPNVIYAIEEPETSQHPDHQKKLIDAFIELTKDDNNQVLITTHSPAIARLLPVESLRLIKKIGGNITVFKDDNLIIREIAENLGVLPDIEISDLSKVKLALCLEGKNDITFFNNISESIPELKAIFDMQNDDRLIKLPMGGSTLQFWVNHDYIGKLKLSQVHIYDSDKGHPEKAYQYKKWVDTINDKGGKNQAYLTSKRELENYIHPAIIKDNYVLELTYDGNWDELDIPEQIAKYNLSISESTQTWDELDKEDKKDRKGKVKNQLNNDHSKKLTRQHLEEINAFTEIESWFKKIAEFLN